MALSARGFTLMIAFSETLNDIHDNDGGANSRRSLFKFLIYILVFLVNFMNIFFLPVFSIIKIISQFSLLIL